MGHINRLCNVLSGFVNGVMPQENTKELFQNEIARVSMDETLSLEDKQKAARILFENYGIVESERHVWLDALA
jgi:hypothetical protein